MNERKRVGNRRSLSRRRFLQLGAAGGAAAIVGAYSGGASALWLPRGTDAGADERFGGGGGDGTIRIGWVSPRTGPLAAFAAADDFVLAGIAALLTEGLRAAGGSYTIEILTEDSQSDPNRAAEVALSLITDDQVDLMVVGNTPETTNPVADQCEATGVPCLSSVAPWQPWFFRSDQADPEAGYDWTYHFFWGLEDIIAVFLDMWSQVDHNGVVGALWPNDGDGIAWGHEELGFPPAFADAGLTLVDPGRYENLSQDFSAQIGDFRSEDVQILTGVPLPPDFTTFWGQAKQQGFTPRIASVGKALLFPDSVDALGDDGDGLSTEVWWSPNHPFASSLTGATCAEFAESFESEVGAQWTQPIGFAHALFEVALDALGRAEAIEPASIRDAIAATSLDTIVGPVAWGAEGLPKNVAKTPLVGGQWTRAEDGPYGYDMVIVSNADHPDIPTTSELRPIPGS